MGKILEVVKKNLKEILLILLGLILGYSLTHRKKEESLTEKVKKSINKINDFSQKERHFFNDRLEAINNIKDDDQRMEEKLKLWESLNR